MTDRSRHSLTNLDLLGQVKPPDPGKTLQEAVAIGSLALLVFRQEQTLEEQAE